MINGIKKLALAGLLVTLAACGNDNDADVASYNLSYAAANFKVMRRVVFMNGITDKYILEVVGLCSIESRSQKLAVTCKVGPDEYKKHYLGLSDNVTYFLEQMNPVESSSYHYKVTFKPQSVIPDI